MKKIITSAGLVALGATGLQADNATGMTRMETSKPWTISGSLRGFYDDNYTASPKGQARSSVGAEIRPSAGLNLFPTEQSYIGLQYTYSMKYYDDRTDHKADHSHEFEAKASHTFSQRYRADFSDSFVYSQEPELLDSTRTTFRTQANGIRNRASLNFKGQVNERVGVAAGYDNSFYDYEQDGAGSRSAELDRVEHLFHMEGRWLVRPGTVGLLGYQIGVNDYTSKDPLFDPTNLGATPPPGPLGTVRDNVSHYGYVGVEHEFNPQLTASAHVGIQYTTFEKASGAKDTVGPYADLSATYTYLPGSSLELGLKHNRNATDQVGTSGNLTVDQESTTVFGAVNHRLRPNVFLSFLASYQNSVFNGGGAGIDNSSEDYFAIGMKVEYRFNQYLSAEGGYNYDRLNSADTATRRFDRNRVYVGIRATY